MSDGERRILIVDDEINILNSLERLLEEEDYIVFRADSAKKGLVILEEEEVAVILSDQRMPEMTGTEFLREARNKYPDTIRIILSGYSELQSIIEAINQGSIFKFISKPWNDEAILAAIEDSFLYYELSSENQLLAGKLKDSNAKLKALNERLERKVEEKTKDLTQTIKSLSIFQEVIEHFPFAILGLDDSSTIVLENSAFQRNLTSGELSLLGLPLSMAPDIDVVTHVRNLIKQLDASDKDKLGCCLPTLEQLYVYRMGTHSQSLGYLVLVIDELRDRVPKNSK